MTLTGTTEGATFVRPHDYGYVSADSHVTEPPDCYADYIDPAFRDRAPHIEHHPERACLGLQSKLEFPQPPVLMGFDDNEVAGACVADIIKAGVLPVAIEFMDRLAFQTSCAYLNETLPYGEAGAIAYYGRRYGLPRPISPHNSYHLWGTGDWDGEIAIVIGVVASHMPGRYRYFSLLHGRVVETEGQG